MAGFFYTGPRGSGKSLGAVHQIYERLTNDRPVATNLDIFPDYLIKKQYKLTRLPDKPSVKHLEILGYAYTDGPISKDDYDENKNGLIVLDEISLYLSSKRDKEFAPLMDWLVQSRKYGWDLLLLAQSKEQVNETVYKSLCDNLVLCKADKLVPIPYIGGLLKKIGLSGRLPDNHTAVVLNGRSEQGSIIETINYSRKKLQNFYNTAQTFNDGQELVNNNLMDMRAVYSVVPDYILSGQKLIDSHNNEIERIKSKVNNSKKEEGNKMAINHHQGKANAIKIGLLCLGLVVFLVLNNPLDNKLLSDVTGSSEPLSQVQTVNEPIPEPVIVNQTENKQAVIDLDPYSGVFETMINDAELSIPFHSENENGLKAIVQITTPIKKSFISLDDLRVLGWYAQKTENVMFLKKGKKTIQVPLSLTSYDVNK